MHLSKMVVVAIVAKFPWAEQQHVGYTDFLAGVLAHENGFSIKLLALKGCKLAMSGAANGRHAVKLPELHFFDSMSTVALPAHAW